MQATPQTILWHSCMEKVNVWPNFLFSCLCRDWIYCFPPERNRVCPRLAAGFCSISIANFMRTQGPNSKAVIFKLLVKELPCATHVAILMGFFGIITCGQEYHPHVMFGQGQVCLIICNKKSWSKVALELLQPTELILKTLNMNYLFHLDDSDVYSRWLTCPCFPVPCSWWLDI